MLFRARQAGSTIASARMAFNHYPREALTAVRALSMRPAQAKPTARPDLSERAFFLTVPFQASVKSLCDKRSINDGAAQLRARHNLALVHVGRAYNGLLYWSTPRALNVRFGSKADI